MFLRNGMRYRRNSNGYPHIFDHARINGNIVDIVRHCPTLFDVNRPRFLDGGLQTGSTLYLWNGMRYHRNYNEYPHIFDHARTIGDIADIGRRRPTTVIQNGMLQTGSGMFLRNGMRYRQYSSGYPHIFDHVRISGDTADLVRRQPTTHWNMWSVDVERW